MTQAATVSDLDIAIVQARIELIAIDKAEDIIIKSGKAVASVNKAAASPLRSALTELRAQRQRWEHTILQAEKEKLKFKSDK